MTPAEVLESAVRVGDEGAIRRLFLPLSEDDRADLLPAVRTIVAATVKQGVDAVGRLGPMLLAAYATLPASELRKLGWRSIHLPAGLEDVLRGRSDQRLGPIVALLLEAAGGRAWYPVRALVREGVIPRPDGPAYTIALLEATQYRPAAELVADDPRLLEIEAWRLFEVEGGGETSLASYEKYTGDSWGELFRGQAAKDGSWRARLLDASLAALARDFGQFRAGWFSRFHESLAPTDDERAARTADYLRLLRSRTRPTVSFAVTALTRISRAGHLQPESILGAAEPALSDAPAGTAKATLKLVGRAGSDRGHARDAALVATAALTHPSADVQRAALALIDSLAPEPDDTVARALEDSMDGIAPSQRAAAEASLARLGGASASSRANAALTDAGDDDAATVRHDIGPTTLVERARPDAAGLQAKPSLTPVESIDALIDTAVSVIETGEPAADLERILEAVGRLTLDRSDAMARLTAALVKRCRTILERSDSRPFVGLDARADITAVLLAWATGTVVDPDPGTPRDEGAGAFLSARAHEVAVAAASGAGFNSVATPTHEGGWIDPPVLVERLLARPPASRLDLVAAILRLAQERRADALRAAKDLDGESGAAVRYALGGEEPIGPTAPWWVAAARVRSPRRDDEPLERRHPGLGPDAGRAARVVIAEHSPRMGLPILVLEVEPEPPGAVDVDLPTVRMYRDAAAGTWSGRSDAAMLRWMGTIQPADREAWASLGSVVIARNVDWWWAEWANRVYLEPFVDPLTTIGPSGRRLIGIALGAKEAGERGLASDIVRLALADGRLTDRTLTEGLRAAAAIGCDRPARWAQSLGDAAAASDAQTRAIAAAIGATLPAIVDRRPAALVPLLGLLDELLAVTRGAAPSGGLDALGMLATRGGRTGRLARSILVRDGSSVTPGPVS